MPSVEVAVMDHAVLDAIAGALDFQGVIHRPGDFAMLHHVVLPGQAEVSRREPFGLRIGENARGGREEEAAAAHRDAPGFLEAEIAGVELEAVEHQVREAGAGQRRRTRLHRDGQARGLHASGRNDEQPAGTRIVPPLARGIERSAGHDEETVAHEAVFREALRHRVLPPGAALDSSRVVMQRNVAGPMPDDRAGVAAVALAELEVEQAAGQIHAGPCQGGTVDAAEFRALVGRGPFPFGVPVVRPRAVRPAGLAHHAASAEQRLDRRGSRERRAPHPAVDARPRAGDRIGAIEDDAFLLPAGNRDGGARPAGTLEHHRFAIDAAPQPAGVTRLEHGGGAADGAKRLRERRARGVVPAIGRHEVLCRRSNTGPCQRKEQRKEAKDAARHAQGGASRGVYGGPTGPRGPICSKGIGAKPGKRAGRPASQAPRADRSSGAASSARRWLSATRP